MPIAQYGPRLKSSPPISALILTGHQSVASMDVSVVIVNWNTRDILRDCLHSVFAQTREVSFEVFVVDNNSHDASAEMVRAEFPRVKLIENAQNRGFAAANNQAIRAASARYILLLNPDTIVLDDAVSRCVAYADLHPDVGVVGCQVLEEEDRISPTSFTFPTPWTIFLELSGLSRAFPHSQIFGRPEYGWWDRTTEQDVDVIAGMFMLVRRKAIEQVGLLDEAYFVYSEETDWCYRLSGAQWRRVFIPSARIIHLDGGRKSTSQISTKMFVQMQKSSMIYQKKNLGRVAWVAAKGVYIVSNAIRMVLWFFLSLVTNDPQMRRKSVAAKAALWYHFLGIEPT